MKLATVRKAIAAGVGVIAIGVLEWTTTATDLGPWLEQLVPAPLVPLVPVVLGGIATVGSVYRASNSASAAAPTLEQPAPPAATDGLPAGPGPAAAAATPPEDDSTAAAGAPVSSPAPFWQGVAAGEPSAATSMVELLPAPTAPSFQ